MAISKAREGDGIPAELFKILKDYAVNVLHSECQQIWETQQSPQDWERWVFTPIPKKASAKVRRIITVLLLLLSHFSCGQLCATP